MFKRRGGRALIAALAATALAATACGGGGSGSGQDSGSEVKGGQFSINIQEPDHLGPHSMCYASECGMVLQAMYAGLVSLNQQGELVYRIAESITTKDQVHWTIKLEKGWTFHNGEPVTAEKYIQAWNWAAYGPHAADTNGFFSVIKGYDAMNPTKEGVEPKAKKLAGLKKVDKYTFKVTLNSPFSQFKRSLLYTPAFAAVTDWCLNNLKACDEDPKGTGPYKLVKWKHDQKIVLKRYEKYKGKDPGNADKIVFKIYSDQATAFKDWRSGDLDIMYEPLPSDVPQARRIAEDRIIEKMDSSFTYLGIPQYTDRWTPKMVHALSLAINRKAITQNLLSGMGIPAQAWVPPGIPGGGGNVCTYCTYDPERAKKLMQEAGGVPVDTITMWTNSGSGHLPWIKAIGNSWRKIFGVDYTVKTPQFSDYLDALQRHKVKGPFRLGWIQDYPSMVNYLKPIYFSGFPANYTGFSSEKFEQLVKKGNAADSQQEAIKYYTQAEKILNKQMPTIPIYFGKVMIVWNDNLAKVPYSPLNKTPVLADVVVEG